MILLAALSIALASPERGGARQSLDLAAVCISLPWATREPLHSTAQSSSRATIVPTAKKAI